MPDTPTPAPALTDEQIEEWHDWYAKGWDRKKFDTYLAAVIARAKREERERIVTKLTAWAQSMQPTSPYTEGRQDAAYRAIAIAQKGTTR